MPDELFRRANELELDAVCITEHNTIYGAEVIYQKGQELGFKVFRGVEVYTDQGDMMVLGWAERIKYYMTPFSVLAKNVIESGGILIPLHPCRGNNIRHAMKDDLPEEVLENIFAIETHNGTNSSKSNAQAQFLADKYGLFGIGGSDAHHVRHVGNCVTVFEDDFDDEEGLIAALRSGRFRACHLSELTARSSDR